MPIRVVTKRCMIIKDILISHPPLQEINLKTAENVITLGLEQFIKTHYSGPQNS